MILSCWVILKASSSGNKATSSPIPLIFFNISPGDLPLCSHGRGGSQSEMAVRMPSQYRSRTVSFAASSRLSAANSSASLSSQSRMRASLRLATLASSAWLPHSSTSSRAAITSTNKLGSLRPVSASSSAAVPRTMPREASKCAARRNGDRRV